MSEITELEQEFHHWLVKVAPEMSHLEGNSRLSAFEIKLLFAISRQLQEIKDAITKSQSSEADRPAKSGRHKRKPQ